MGPLVAGVAVSEEEEAAEGVEDLEVCSSHVKFVVRDYLPHEFKEVDTSGITYKSLGC